jgi:hypothetical protein
MPGGEGDSDMTLWRIRATVDDRPGFLSVLTASLALKSVNILSVQVHATEGGAIDDFLVDAPSKLTVQDLIEAVERGRGRDPWVARADARGLADEPTRVLALAARVSADPGALRDVLLALLGDCAVGWRPGGVSPDARDAHEFCLVDPSGGTLLVRRENPAFAPAEYARAQALVKLAMIASNREYRPERAAG